MLQANFIDPNRLWLECETLARGPNLALRLIQFGPRSNTQSLLKLPTSVTLHTTWLYKLSNQAVETVTGKFKRKMLQYKKTQVTYLHFAFTFLF